MSPTAPDAPPTSVFCALADAPVPFSPQTSRRGTTAITPDTS